MSDVFILGAGFSKAIHKSMPLLCELGPMMKRDLQLLHHGRGVNLASTDQEPDLERLLTYLATRHPWQSEPEHLRSRALFHGCQEKIGTIIQDREGEAQDCLNVKGMPAWLGHLVQWWRQEGSWVVTLNYDTLVEWAYQEVTHSHFSSLYRVPITPAVSRIAPTPECPVPDDGFLLLKLHGSANWYYSGGEFSGETVYWAPWPSHQSVDVRATGVPWFQSIFGLVPFIVPPTADKGPFYTNQTLRATWQLAKYCLSAATRVFFLGCSLPPTDYGLRYLFLNALTWEKQTFYVVNLPSSDIRERYEQMLRPELPPREHIRRSWAIEDAYVQADDPIPAFVRDLVSGNLQETAPRRSE